MDHKGRINVNLIPYEQPSSRYLTALFRSPLFFQPSFSAVASTSLSTFSLAISLPLDREIHSMMNSNFLLW